MKREADENLTDDSPKPKKEEGVAYYANPRSLFLTMIVYKRDHVREVIYGRIIKAWNLSYNS